MVVLDYILVQLFYSHVNYSVTKITLTFDGDKAEFYSHVNYSVTKMECALRCSSIWFYSHVNYSVTKIDFSCLYFALRFTVT